MTSRFLVSTRLVALLVLASTGCPSSDAPASAPLIARPFLPRLSIPTSYLPCPLAAAPGHLPRDPRCPDPSSSASPPPTSSLTVSKDTAGQAFGGTEGHRRAIEALLGAHEEEDFEEVLALFETANRDPGPKSAALLSDFAAAHLVRAQALDQPADLARGLERALEAIGRDADFAPAQFNVGLLCQALGLKQCGRTAWEGYLPLDGGPPWAEEAVQYHAQLAPLAAESPPKVRLQLSESVDKDDAVRLRFLASSYPTTAESWALEVLLGKWGGAVVARDPAAETFLGYARMVAEETGATRQGRPLSAALKAVAAALPLGQQAAPLPALASGHQAYSEAIELSQKRAPERASQRFRVARQALGRGGSPFALAAELQRIASLVQSSHFEEGLVAIGELGQHHGANLGAFAGRAEWLRAFAESHLREPLEAVASYRRAAKFYGDAGDRSNLANMEARHAEMLRLVEQTEEGWRSRYRALSGLGSLEDPSIRAWVLDEASEAALDLGLSRVAQHFQAEAVREARLAGENLILVESLRQSGRVLLQIEQPEQALAALKEAAEVALNFATSEIYRAFELKVLEVQAGIDLQSDPAQALKHLEKAIALAKDLGQRLYLPELHTARAEALLVLDRDAEALASLYAAVALVESEWEATLERRTLGDHEAFWPTYFGAGRLPFNRLILRLAERDQVSRALSVAERARARELLDLLRGPQALRADLEAFFRGLARPLTARELIAHLPEGTAVIEYVLAEDRLLTWVFGHDGIRYFDDELAGDALTKEVKAALKSIRSGTQRPVTEGLLAALFDRLVAPLADHLRRGERLIFVPDGILHALPFAALYDRSAHSFLIESHPVAVAPSATLYTYALARNRQLASPLAPSVLGVCDPAFSLESFPLLSRLDGAAAECAAVVGLYPTSRLLGGEAATKSRFLAELGRYSVLHFGGHAIGHPSDAYLVLAPDDADSSGTLYAHELLARGAGRTRLAVLSACNTAAEQGQSGQGVAALVRPLIGAGIPAVIGTLWPVDDVAATHWTRALHRHLLSGKDAAVALQATQLDLLHDEQVMLQLPRSWAAFQLVGHASLRRPIKEE